MENLWNPARMALGLVVVLAIFVPLEALFPLVRRQFWRRPGVGTDLLHFFVTTGLRRLLTLVAAYVLVTLLGFLVHPPLQRAMLAPPWWVQCAVALVVFEVGAYWGHRWAHTVPFLWRFHAVHHSSEHLDWLAASRLHPVDQTFIRVCGILPVYLLGFTKAHFAFLMGFEALLALFIHANVRLRFGWLEWLVATPIYHHWHHANEGRETTNKNFGGLFPWVDALFGTLLLPRRFPHRYGIDEPMPPGYLGQLAQPFRRPPPGAPTEPPLPPA
jgi:sterol desaturase/sphingolipid hydroxylase (fatty acid hydroxylase superfamily)